MRQYECVDDLLKGLKRPATHFEIILALNSVKNERSIRAEIERSVKGGTLRRITVPVKGCGGELVVYLRKMRVPSFSIRQIDMVKRGKKGVG